MEVANQIFFIVFALITFAILLSVIPQFQAPRSDWPSIYWPLSISFYTLSALVLLVLPLTLGLKKAFRRLEI